MARDTNTMQLEDAMAHFLVSANYTAAGLAGLEKDGAASRIKALEDAAKSVGGKLEAMYWSFGKYDVVLLLELPDNAAAAALSTTVAAAGVATVRTTVLLSANEVDKAFDMRPKYRAPGG
jgi:uncharacterized protein with GYD domain